MKLERVSKQLIGESPVLQKHTLFVKQPKHWTYYDLFLLNMELANY